MFIGRTFATIAEMSFIIQVVILLREAGFGYGKRLVNVIAWVIIPLIVLAEISSWYAVLTRNYMGSVIEESLWTVTGIMLLMSFVALWPKVSGGTRYYLTGMIIYTVGFILFMVNVDVPMYWERWISESARNVTYLGLYNGMLDTLKSCMVSFDPAKWRDEIPWMTLYFTVTVWVSMAFAFAPKLEPELTTQIKN